MRLLVVVPCRDEASLVGRRIANLALCAWPASREPHRVVVVDDGSRDGTGAAAAVAIAEHFAARSDVEARVVANEVRPGKPGAVRAGLAQGAAESDLVVLTDADVVLEPHALVELARAFERDPRLALACGAQRFVADLAADGTCRARDGGEPRDAGGTFDRWTAVVRRLESRAGILFSVHGQLAAWRADLDLAPTIGVAADDVDLRFQVKARDHEPRRVELVPAARFLEVKTPAGPGREAQAARRARAWFQVVRRGPIPARGVLETIQAWAYRAGPRAAPMATWCAVPAMSAILFLLGARSLALASLASGVALALTPLGRSWIRLVRTIAAASRAERREPVPERWETPRA
ncbi:MAG: glycosyltransferase family 2 protein [Planctomycetota bacterium]|nr:glycosyltransferase family 2 protein [Planctomycetota bacterium]